MKNKFRLLLSSLENFVTKYGFDLGLVGLMVVGLYFRIAGAERIININLDDGGRDILVAKRMAEGTVSWLVAPDSAGIFPNTPIYFWLLALAYKIGGGIYGVISLHILAGTGLIWISYLIGKLAGDKWSGLFLATLVTISPGLINASQVVWQTHVQWFFVGIAFYVWLRAMTSVRTTWYLASPIISIFLLSLYNGVLPVVGIMSLGLIINWFRPPDKKLTQTKLQAQALVKTKDFLAVLFLSGLVWLTTIYGIVLYYDVSTISKLWTELEKTGSNLGLWPRIVQLWQHLIQLFSLNPDFKTNLMVIVFSTISITAIGLVALRIEKSTKLEYLFRFFWLMVLSFTLGLVFAGGESFGWRISAQSFVLLLLVGLTPDLLAPIKSVKLIIYIGILSLLLSHNWAFLRSHGQYSSYLGFELSQKTAKFMLTDAINRGISPTSFGILVKKPGSGLFPIQDLAANWNSASLQLALELHNPIYIQRVKIVPWPIFWSNYLQPDEDYFYLVCPEYGLKPTCLTQISDIDDFIIQTLEPIVVDHSLFYHLFFLTKKS